MNYRYREDAKRDLREAANFYGDRQPGLGVKFYREVEEAVRLIRRHPQGFPFFRDDMRRYRLKGFKQHAVVYQILPEEIVITSVWNYRRNPDEWLRRGLED